jgi:hypothetical protein
MARNDRANLDRLLRSAWERQTILLARAGLSNTALPSIPKKDLKILWIGCALGAGVACVVALIAGNGGLLRSSVIALVVCGSLFFLGAIYGLGWLRSYSHLILFPLAIIAAMSYLGYKVWPVDQITVDNIKENVEAWSLGLGMSVEKIPDPESYFRFTVTYKNGLKVGIRRARDKDHDQYLDFGTIVTPSPEEEIVLRKFTKEQSQQLADELVLELARAKIGYRLIAQPPVFQGVILDKPVPITGLNRDVFIGYLDEMQSDLVLTEQKILLGVTQNRN